MDALSPRSEAGLKGIRIVGLTRLIVWLLIVTFMATACDDSTPPATIAPSSKSAAAQTDAMADQPSAEGQLSKYHRFVQLTTEDGLSNDQIRNVIQDGRGFMWFATVDGLDRYDGASVKIYRHDPDDAGSLSHDIARALLVDRDGDLWVGTWSGGLNLYDAEADAFISYRHDPDNPHTLSNNTVRVVYEDRDGIIWVGTTGGLNRLDRATGQFTRYQHDPDDPTSLGNDIVWTIIEDSTGVLWADTEGGLNRFDPDTETFTHYHHLRDDPLGLSHDAVRSIYEDHSGNLWLGTEGGLDRLNPERTQITSYQHDADDPDSLSHDIINSVIEDRAGRLWVGTWGGGLDQFDRDTETFVHYRHRTDDPYSLSSDAIWHIFEGQQGMLLLATEGGVSLLDSSAKPFHHYRSIAGNPDSLSDNGVNALYAGQEGIIWVGANSGGLNRFDRQAEEFTQLLDEPSDPINIADEPVTAIYEDVSGILWIGTRGMGLIKYDRDSEQVTNYRYDNADPHSLSHDSVVNILEDQTGTLWIGTYGGGINAFDRGTEQFTRYEHDPADPYSLGANVVLAAFEDQAGVLWVGTNSAGLNKFDREIGKFTHYRNDPTDPDSLSSDTVLALHEDQAGSFWIGTSTGLNEFDRQNDQVSRHFSTKDGLPADSICGIVEDEQEELWLCTLNGLSRFDPRDETFRNYTESDGLQSNTFTLFSPPAKSESGEIFYGGANGFNAFLPIEIVDTQTPPPVYITEFLLANRPVPIQEDSVLKKSILETNQLTLSYLDNVLSFEFAALNYRAPEESGYKYKMEGFDASWTETDNTRRFAIYTNLDPGDYVFRVLAANNDDVWNEEGTALKITITPPWWETTWFRVGLSLLAISLLAGGYRWRVKSIEARNQALETQVAERTKELEAANQAKSLFLASMSHELRTPLNAILGFARLMSRDGDLNREQRERLAIINRSGEHLLHMVGDILTLSRIEAQRVRLVEERFDFLQMLDDLGRVFQSRAEGKGLHFDRDLADDLPDYLLGDAGKLRQVLVNLLDNAVKFTQEGEVSLRVRMQGAVSSSDTVRLHLEVEDSGPGIPHDKMDDIFGTFVRVEQPQPTQQGTGLGLAISKSLVDMMGGEITVSSEAGQGTRFAVTVPMLLANGDAIAPDEAPRQQVIGLQPGQQDWRILVVDDNRENLLLLSSLLTQIGFSVQEAENGEEAVTKYQDWRPDFIWMDMRMPVLDGQAATRKIRALPGGQQVKIVAITASLLEESQTAVQEAGCDNVVLKPFRDHEIFDIMARELDVEFIYRDAAEGPARHAETMLTAEDLAVLPPELLAELRRTTLVADREATLEVIGQIEAVAPNTGVNLRTMVEDFRMGHVRELLKETETKNGN